MSEKDLSNVNLSPLYFLRFALVPVIGFCVATCLSSSRNGPSIEETLGNTFGCVGVGQVLDLDPEVRKRESIKAAMIDYAFNCYDPKDNGAIFEEVYDEEGRMAYVYKLQ